MDTYPYGRDKEPRHLARAISPARSSAVTSSPTAVTTWRAPFRPAGQLRGFLLRIAWIFAVLHEFVCCASGRGRRVGRFDLRQEVSRELRQDCGLGAASTGDQEHAPRGRPILWPHARILQRIRHHDRHLRSDANPTRPRAAALHLRAMASYLVG